MMSGGPDDGNSSLERQKAPFSSGPTTTAPLRIEMARVSALCQLLVLKSNLRQMFSNGVRRRILCETPQPNGLPAIVLAGHRWNCE